MGLGIGQITGPLASIRSAPEFGQARLGGNESPLRGSALSQGENGIEAFLRRQEETGTRARTSTLSAPGAALRTISATVEQARDRTPTIQEIRQQFRTQSVERRAETQRTAFNRPGGDSTRRLELQIPEPSAQVRNFVTDADDSRSSVFSRVGQEERGTALGLSADREGTERPVSFGQGEDEGVAPSLVSDGGEVAVRDDVGAERPAPPSAPEPALIDTEVIRDEPEPVGFAQAQGDAPTPTFSGSSEVRGPGSSEAGSQLDITV